MYTWVGGWVGVVKMHPAIFSAYIVLQYLYYKAQKIHQKLQ